MRKILLALTLTTLFMAGCGASVAGSIGRGMTRYGRSDFPGALNELAEVSEREDRMNSKAAVRYLVYRGLSHYHLGQRDQAYMFLVRGRQTFVRGEREWLTEPIIAEMEQALAVLASGMPQAPGPTQTTIVVVPPAPTQ
jgi:hypothetical protein